MNSKAVRSALFLSEFLKACAGLKKGGAGVFAPAPFIPAPAIPWRVALQQSPPPFRRMNWSLQAECASNNTCCFSGGQDHAGGEK